MLISGALCSIHKTCKQVLNVSNQLKVCQASRNALWSLKILLKLFFSSSCQTLTVVFIWLLLDSQWHGPPSVIGSWLRDGVKRITALYQQVSLWMELWFVKELSNVNIPWTLCLCRLPRRASPCSSNTPHQSLSFLTPHAWCMGCVCLMPFSVHRAHLFSITVHQHYIHPSTALRIIDIVKLLLRLSRSAGVSELTL